MASGYDGTIRIDSKIDTTGFNQGVKQMSGGLTSIMGVVGKLAALVGVAFAVGKIIGFAKEALVAGAQLQRLEQAAVKVGATFGVTAEEVQKIVSNVESLGIQNDIANQSFLDMARNGLDTSLLPALARGAQDLNAFSEQGESSSDVLQTLMNGVVELSPIMLRTAGVIVDLESAERKWATANDVVYTSMTAQQKQAAALVAVLEQLKGVEGLYELSQRTAAGQMSSNIRIMNNFKAAIGAPFQNALYIVVRTINGLVTAFTLAIGPGGKLHDLMVSLAAVATWVANAFRAALQMIAGLFGITIPDMGAIATTAEDATGAIDDASGAAGDLADNTNKASKAAKGALASFDQLNVLQQQGGEGGTGGGGGGVKTPVPFTPIDSGLLDEINAKLAEFKANLAGLGPLFQPIIDALSRLWTASEPLRETLWKGLQWFWDHVLVPFGAWVGGELVPHFLDLLGAASITLNSALIALQPLGKWLWDNFLQPLAAYVGASIIQWLDDLKTGLLQISDWITAHPKEFQAFAVIVGIIALAFWAWMSPLGLVIVIVGVLMLALMLLSGKFPTVTKAAQDCWKAITDAWGSAAEWFYLTVEEPMREGFEETWNGIVNWCRGAVNVLIGILNGVGSAVVWFINQLIAAINTIHIHIAKTLLTPAIDIGFNLKSLTFTPIGLLDMIDLYAGLGGGGSGAGGGYYALATGAVIPPNARFAAVLGDQRSGRNLEAPEALIRQIVREESGNNKSLTIKFDGTMSQLIRTLRPYIVEEDRRIGKSLVKVD